ncbi:protein kinase [Nocardiopsis sp. HNM0947]|uniref:Protein kinase n=1 Tax=Nocardiopsis coralli TaxID=2772213 RepID=A0ABR9P3K5_9ACTN|nr:serine/threonine-protein kinase [Nocardiopsis coralli]MBE2998434.1 protein kinase [Nocardiopsis coralli]
MSNGHNSGKPLRAGDPHELNGYRVASRLGRGGMGTVYLAEDGAGHKVALKLIHPDLADDEDFRRRFAREVESARRVARFSTAGVIDARLEGEPLYIVSEYVPGPNLDEAVRADGAMSGGTLESLAMGVAAALTAIHGSGIIHRDLKPANVLLSPVGPKVIDFGIARALDDSAGAVTRSSQLMGTPSYMAPELILGEQPTAAADIFAWGCLVAFAGIGSAPYDAPTVPAVLHNISSAEPRLEGLDQDLSELVVAALDKDPRNRPTSQQLLARLTGQPQPEESEVNRTISTSWAPPASAPIPGAPPQETAAHGAEAPSAPSGPQQPQGGPDQPPSGPQQPVAGTPPQGQTTTPYTTPPTQAYTAQQGFAPSGPQPPHQPPSGPQQPRPGQVPPGHQPHAGPHPQQHPYGHPSPPQGQQAFAAPAGPGGPGGPGGPHGPGGPGQQPGGGDPSGRKRRKRLTMLAGGAAVLVMVLVAAVVLTRPPSVPDNTLSLYNTDFSTHPDWIRGSFDSASLNDDGYWPQEQAALLHVDPTSQETRGEWLVREDEALPDRVLVTADAHVLEGPDESTFGVRCWGNDGEDEFTRYDGVVRADGQQAEIRRSSDESGDNALASTTDVSGFEEYEHLEELPAPDPDSDERAGIAAYDASEAVSNTVTLACEYDDEEDTLELGLWVNGDFAVSAVDDNPLPDDAEDEEDRRQTGITARAAPGHEATSDVMFSSFSVHEISDEN